MTIGAGASPTVLPVRRRPELILAATGTEDAPRWTVKDPLTRHYFQLSPIDYFVFQQLDGTASIADIQQRFFQQFAPQKLTAPQILAFVQRLWTQGLVTIDRFGLSADLIARQEEMQERSRGGWFSKLLAIRFRGVDPDRFLTACLPYVGWLFSPLALLLGFCLILAAMVLVVNDADLLWRELPRLDTFLQADRFLWLVLTISAVKVLHELGHAFACKKVGGECHEIGLMLLVFTPCLYCNVSDAWLFRSRWQRAAVSGAGIFVELVLAAICTFLWRFSVPGLFHALCLDVMLICSVNTLLLNGNPLLRYDGYYLMSDVLDVPNLRSRAQGIVRNMMSRLFLGAALPEPVPTRGIQRWGLAAYGVASALYSWVLVLGILWMLYRFAERRELEGVILLLAPLVILGRLWSSSSSVYRFVSFQAKAGQWQPLRFALTTGIALLLIGLLLAFPFPRRVRATAQIVAADVQPVFISAPGQVQFPQPLRAGQSVTAGQVLATLTNRELERELEKLQGEVKRLQQRIDHLSGRQFTDPQAAALLPAAQAALADYDERLKQRTADLIQLTLEAPRAGVLLPPEAHSHRTHADPRLQREGEPFDAANAGAWLEVGTLFCRIGDPEERDALFYVDQGDVPLIAPGDAAELAVSQTGGVVYAGVVQDVSASPLQQLPPALLASQSIPVQPTAAGAMIPVHPLYEVRVRLSEPGGLLVLNQLGQGRITVGKESLAARWLRSLRRTFTFDL